MAARQWAINPSPTLSTEPFTVDLSPNGRIVATHNGIYSTYYDPRTSQTRPEIEAQFVDFFDFRTNKEVGQTDGYYDYGAPSWLGSDQVLTTSFGGYNAQVLVANVGAQTRGSDFYWDPGRFTDTGMNTHILTDAEATRAGDRFAVMRRPSARRRNDPSVATIQIYRIGSPIDRLHPDLHAFGPGRPNRLRRRPVLVAPMAGACCGGSQAGDLHHARHRRSRLRPEAQADRPRWLDPGSQPRTPAATLRSRSQGDRLREHERMRASGKSSRNVADRVDGSITSIHRFVSGSNLRLLLDCSRCT